jgi:ribosomal 30S subunit maturation factor RimM
VEVERINATNYLHIKTDEALLKDKTAKLFLIPKITPFVVGVDLDAKTITVSGAKDILEAS